MVKPHIIGYSLMGDSVEMVAVDVARLYQCSNRYFR